MPTYVLSLLVKPKLKIILSVLRYRLSRFRGEGQNQRVATFWRHKSIEIDRLNYKLVSICGPFRSKKRLDNLTKIQSWNAWISSWNAQMLHYPLCRESVLGMPRTEIEIEFDMVFCFGIRLAPYAVFSTRINLQHIARPVAWPKKIRQSTLSVFLFLAALLKNIWPLTENCHLQIVKSNSVNLALTDLEG